MLEWCAIQGAVLLIILSPSLQELASQHRQGAALLPREGHPFSGVTAEARGQQGVLSRARWAVSTASLHSFAKPSAGCWVRWGLWGKPRPTCTCAILRNTADSNQAQGARLKSFPSRFLSTVRIVACQTRAGRRWIRQVQSFHFPVLVASSFPFPIFASRFCACLAEESTLSASP